MCARCAHMYAFIQCSAHVLMELDECALTIFLFEVHLFLVGSVTVTGDMVLFPHARVFTWFDIREHPPAIPDEWSSFFSLGQSSRPLNLSGNLYRQKFGYELFSGILSSSSSERFT
jgi:hypothetical protein